MPLEAVYLPRRSHIGAPRYDLPVARTGEGRPRTSGFRPDIQALRALAVVSVLLYHLWPNRLTGGFVGVDVFFVISGYLITSHLLRERESTGRIAVGHFWARRAARLLPASLLTLLTTAVAVVVLVPRSLWEQFLNEIVASTLYVQNWRLMADSVDYLAAENQASPVQHFWTLSAEEQFYVLLPLLLIIAFWLFRRAPWYRVALLVIAIATLASFAYSVWLMAQAPSEAYFSTFTRAWEFGAGALLAFLPALPGAWRHIVALSGLAAIGVSVVAYTGATPFPGVSALLPVLGTAAVILARSPAVDAIGRFAPIAFLGRVSYAVYLWHWPLIVLVPFATGIPLTTWHKLAIGAIAIVLASLSTRFVEDGTRRSPRLLAGRRPRAIAALTVGAMALVLAIPAAATVASQLTGQRTTEIAEELTTDQPECFGAQAMDPALAPCDNPELDALPLVPAVEGIRTDDANRDRDDCWSAMDDPTLNMCSLGPEAGYDKHLIAVGDSHNNTLIGAYESIAEQNNWRIDVAGHEGGYWTTEELEQNTVEGTNACSDWREAVTNRIAATSEIDGIVVTRFSGHEDEDEVGVAAMAEAWAQRADESIPVIAIRDNPHLLSSTVACIEEDPDTANDRCSRPIDEALIDDGLARAVERDANARLVDMTPFYCSDDRCLAVIGGVIVYRDGTHLTATYASSLAPYLGREISSALNAG